MPEIKEEKRIRPRITSGTFLICLTIACLGWIIVTFSKEYVQTLECKVTYSNLPKGIDSISSSDSIAYITFKSKGFNYLKYSFTDKYTTLDLSIKELTQKKGKRNVYSFSKKELSNYIIESGMYGLTFVEIEKPESLTIYLK
jgi:hypothetical protein